MRLDSIARRLALIPDLRTALDRATGVSAWQSLAAEARPLFVAAHFHLHPRKTLIVANTYEKALQWQARLAMGGVPADQIRILPSGLSVLFEDASPETVALSDRIGALRFLVQPGPGIVIATPQAALERSLPRDVLETSFLSFSKGQTIDSDQTIDGLKRMGYEPSEPVRVPGQFSRRGGIIDVFPMGADRPVRIELFDTDIESLRSFDPMSQRSIGAVKELIIAPSRETLLPAAEAGIEQMLEHTLQLELSRLDDAAAKTLEQSIRADEKALASRAYFDRLDLYRPLIQPDSECAVDLAGEGSLVVLDEPLELEATAARAEEELGQALEARAKRGEILSATAHDFMLPPEHLGRAENLIAITAMGSVPAWISPDLEFEFESSSLEPYRGQSHALTQALQNWLSGGLTVIMATDQPMRSRSVLGQIDIYPGDLDPEAEAFAPGMVLVEGNPAGGFVMPGIKLAVVSDQELFGVGRLKLPQRKFNEGVPIATVLDLKPGDFVVHINFGIGVYQGLITREVDGVRKEFLHIEYKAPDRLFVPADQLDRVQKYLAPGDAPPKINRLTGGEWQKTVGKAREEAREFARDLIKLYASRKSTERVSYGPDTPWQSEMESTFPWSETPSQLQAIEDVKEDLQVDYPMDRLVCGDVGFGKTEVAIRAAFKVAQAGKQVAMLCPTTILSEQHFRNFKERLGAFPTRIEILNRFRTAAERKDILARLAAGEIDMIIGTHALLSADLKFQDLGLLIVDEEQKFGVKHKESLKALRVNIDVLTMSATPIPRTLSMAMMNIRQMSLINDPPPGRLPIRTFVRPYSQEVVREALLRELARGGQVYYVFNRVEGIHHVAERLRKLVPTARIAVAHGQMHEKELEPVMVGFIKGEIDILLSTTIIENGLDVANANTLIIENADYFGLSQLYQLRGRVGRSDRQAYAYMLYQDTKSLTENASARLSALSEFSQLGAGYALAFRDLQIRGAGELLGARQSGQMIAIGYDLYTQLIESEVQFLKTYADGERPTGLTDPLAGLEPLPSFDLPVTAMIPDTYVPDQGQRLYFYQRLMSSRDAEELATAAAEMEDRYGRLPSPVKVAVEVMALRIRARDHGVEKVDGKGGRLAVTFSQARPPALRVLSLIQGRQREAYMSQDRLIWPYSGDPVRAAQSLLETIKWAEEEVERQRAMLPG